MTDELVSRAEQHVYQQLFIHDLHWSAPDHPPIGYTGDGGHTVTATNVSYRGLRVWVCDEKPGSKVEAELDRLIAKTSTDRLLIFYNNDQQVWRWPVRLTKDNSTTSRLTSHWHRSGSPDEKFAARLDAIRLPLDVTLDANTVLSRVRAAFDVETQNETKYASKLMTRMYTALERAYPPEYESRSRDHQISVTLARILFLMFGDDTEMWEADTFRDFIHHHTVPDGSDTGAQLNRLFHHLDIAPASPRNADPDLTLFPYVNGGIFEERVTLPELNRDFRDAVLDACAVDWSTISPAIFGSMFQSVRDAQTRRELGEHYTSEENILKTLNPLFLDELRSEFDRARTMKDEKRILNQLWKRLGEIQYLDPACGCGNFIIVAYRELRNLELRIMERLQELSGVSQLSFDPTLSLKVTLDHFYGIEIDEWPARIAKIAMFLIDRQCDLNLQDCFGEAPNRLPIRREARIVSGASALELDWTTICQPTSSVIVAGNPPFLGHATRSEKQAEELKTVWGKEDISRLDYVTGWHAKALSYFGTHTGVWAFVTTNSITQGDPVPHLFGPIFSAGWRIKFAHRTFPWTSEASGKAAVHCVIIGFAKKLTGKARLFDYNLRETPKERRVDSINAYLVEGPDIFVTKRMEPMSPGLPIATFGNMPRDDGGLIVDPDEYDMVAADPIANKYLRPFLGADELLNGKARWCLWLVDAKVGDLSESLVLAERIEGVRAFRARSTAASTRQMAQTPHLFGQRPALYTAPYVVIPRVSSERRQYYAAMHVDPEVIASDATFTAADPDGFLFAIISSAMFMTWQKMVGGRLKSDLRFSNTIVWNNLPLPHVDPDLRQQIIDAGACIRIARDQRPDRTLAQHYGRGEMDAVLRAAHDRLDVLVDRAFGAEASCDSEVQRQRILFSAYSSLNDTLL